MKHTIERSFSSTKKEDYEPALKKLQKEIAEDLVTKLDSTIMYYLPREGKELFKQCEASGDFTQFKNAVRVIGPVTAEDISIYCYQSTPFLKVWKPAFTVKEKGRGIVMMRAERKFEGLTWDPDAEWNKEDERKE